MPTLRDLTRAGLWLGLYVLLALWPLLLLLAAPAPRGGGLSDELGSALGFLAISLMAMQFFLTARFEWLAPPFGTDLVYAFHRHVTIAVVVFALLHPIVLFGSSLGMALGWLVPGAAPWDDRLRHLGDLRAGGAGHHLLAAQAAQDAVRGLALEPRPPGRRGGAARHLACAPGRAAPLAPGGPLALAGLDAGLGGAHPRVRLFKPLALRRRPWTVQEVRPEPGESITLVLEPEGHDGFRFRCGQFVWLTLGASPLAGREHPFSIASSALAWPRVELTVKAVGDFTRGLLSMKPGARAYLDGPFGTMSVDAFPDADGYVFIAGGSGIVPCMSMLRTLADRGDRRPHLVIYGSSELPRTLFREQLEALSTRIDLRVVHALERPPPGWRGEQGYVTQAMLDRWVPHRGRHAYFVCGPGPMMDVVEASLTRLGVPLSISTPSGSIWYEGAMSANRFQVGLVQMAMSRDPARNTATAAARIRGRAGHGAQVVCLPELYRTPYFCQTEDTAHFDLAERSPARRPRPWRRAKRRRGGGLPVFERRAPGLYHNTAVVFDADGTVAGRYRKMHIPDDPPSTRSSISPPATWASRPSTRGSGASACWSAGTSGTRRPRGSRRWRAPSAVLPDRHRLAPARRPRTAQRQRDAWQTMQRAPRRRQRRATSRP